MNYEQHRNSVCETFAYNKALVIFIKGVLQMGVNRFANKFIHSLVDDISFKYKYINSDNFRTKNKTEKFL